MPHIKKLGGYAAVAALVALWTVVLHVLAFGDRDIPGVLYLYVLVVSLAALRWSLQESLFAVVLSIVAADLWVLPPEARFRPDMEHGLRLLIFLAVALTQSLVQSRLVETRKQLRSQFEMQQHIAEMLQSALLPQPVLIPGYNRAFLYEPAAVGANVGGDFLDIFEIDEEHVGILLGDVTGHGVEAAQTAQVRYTLTAYALQGNSPANCLAAANASIRRDRTFENFSTVFLGILEVRNHVLTYASAGHDPAILSSPGCPARPLTTGGLPLGVADSEIAGYENNSVTMECGATLAIYTDGVTEARGEDREFYGIDRLQQLITSIAAEQPALAVKHVYAEVSRFANGNLRDDMAIIWIHRPAEPGSVHLAAGHSLAPEYAGVN